MDKKNRKKVLFITCVGISILLLLLSLLLLVQPTARVSHQSGAQRPASDIVQALAMQVATTSPQTDAQISTDAYTVIKVIDGDTIKIDLNGTVETIRLIGINSPETVDPRKPVECFGKEASDMAKQLLTGRKVRIEKDSSQGDLDKYGRTLAYVYRDDGLFIDAYMVANGYAYEYTYDAPYRYQSLFKQDQANAKAAQKGLWKPGVCMMFSKRMNVHIAIRIDK